MLTYVSNTFNHVEIVCHMLALFSLLTGFSKHEHDETYQILSTFLDNRLEMLLSIPFQTIKDIQLLAIIAVLVLLLTAILIVWQILSPFEVKRYELENQVMCTTREKFTNLTYVLH